jgi:hypothetical protein
VLEVADHGAATRPALHRVGEAAREQPALATRVVDVPLGADVPAGIAAHGRVVVETKEQGASKKGSRSSRDVLPVAPAPV